MAYTYSSWEYSQGPILYIDTSGFKELDDNKNFTYFYVVTYSPVEYKRKVTDEKGASFYEYKYSFGTGLESRKTLGEYTFKGKSQMTKTVSHSVTEDGFKDTINKTFYIDTNINSNIQTNAQIVIDPLSIVNTTEWKFFNQSSFTLPNIGRPYIGWKTVSRTGYRTEYGTSYSSYSYWKNTGIGWSGAVPSEGGGSTYKVQDGYLYKKTYSYSSYTYSYQVPYTYTELYNSYCTLNIGEVRNKIKEHLDYSSVILLLKTSSKLNTSPDVYIDTSTTATAKRLKLTPKNAGSIPANGYIEYYIPNSVIMSNFSGVNSVYIIIQKGSCTSSDGIIIEACTHIETEVAKIPYINLLVQSYSKATDSWTTCCTVPYLNYKEIEDLRQNKNHVSKNLFLPSNLPPTDDNYRIKLDTNLVAKDAEAFTNFRLDILSNQIVPTNSIESKTLYINNDSIDRDNEIKIGDIDDFKLNILGVDNYAVKPYAGFLKKGANDICAYLRHTVAEIDESIPEENKSKNEWYGFLSSKNGGWASNNLFVANTFDFPQVDILQGGSSHLINDILTFEVPYASLEPNSSYTLFFKANAKRGFSINNINTVKSSDESRVVSSRLYSETSYDSSKVSVTNCNYVFYTPQYKRMNGAVAEYVSEVDRCNRDIEMSIKIDTKNITNEDKGVMTIVIRRHALKNISIKDLQCLLIKSDKTKYIDVTEPYAVNVNSGRIGEKYMTIYYDGFRIEHINPMLFRDMVYLRNELDRIRREYTLKPYPWTSWVNIGDQKDDEGHMLGVGQDQPLRAVHFDEVKQCCIDTYTELLKLDPPVYLNSTPTLFRNETGLVPLNDDNINEGYVLQHAVDKDGNKIDVDKYFPEWRKIIDLINRN